MDPKPLTIQQIDFILQKCVKITKNIGIDFSSAYFLQTSLPQLKKMHQRYQFNLNNFNQTIAEHQFEQDLIVALKDLNPSFLNQSISAIKMPIAELKESKILGDEQSIQYKQSESKISPIGFLNIEGGQKHIIVQKEREIQNEKYIYYQWKNARNYFYTHQLQQKLKNAKIQEEKRRLIMDLFDRTEEQWDDELMINLNNLGELSDYRELIGQIKKQFELRQGQLKRQLKQCLPMKQIIPLKLNTLKILIINYKRSKYNQCIYSISAFQFFKVVHENKLLNQISIKGVCIQQFQQFITIINPLNDSYEQKREEHNWIMKFNPSKQLKLAIDAQLQFKLSDKWKVASFINDLAFFCGLLQQLSDIATVIKLGKWKNINQWENNLQDLWKVLRTIKKIKIKIQAKRDYFPVQSASFIRSSLFGGLASFTEITHLSFKQIRFNSQISVNVFMVIQQLLSTIFKNNSITHFQLKQCTQFPVLPEMPQIQSIQFSNFVTFQKKFDFVRTQSKQSLRSIRFISIYQQWKFSEGLFNKLQNLIISKCNNLTFDEMSSQTPSNIKNLNIYNSAIGNLDCLSMIFPKLVNLTYLQMWEISFDHLLLNTIPSLHLEELSIWDNSKITDESLKLIDSKWPLLKLIQIRRCKKITENAWFACNFEGLIELRVDIEIMGERKQVLSHFKRRGVRVYLFD